jgi:hypothetical protein
MTARLGFREGLFSALVFGGILAMLISVDPQVRDQAENLVRNNSMSSLSSRATDLGGALISAARHQSIDNAPLVVFATVGVVLTLFMLKS